MISIYCSLILLLLNFRSFFVGYVEILGRYLEEEGLKEIGGFEVVEKLGEGYWWEELGGGEGGGEGGLTGLHVWKL